MTEWKAATAQCQQHCLSGYPLRLSYGFFWIMISLGPRLIVGSQLRRFERLKVLRTYVRDDPTVTYDLHAAYSKDPETTRIEDGWDAYTKIQQAALKAGKRPPKKKKPKYDAVGLHVGIRFINEEVPLVSRGHQGHSHCCPCECPYLLSYVDF